MSQDDAKKPETGEQLMRAVNVTRGGVVVAGRVEWSGTSATRRRGLLGRDSLAPDEGMYIAPSQWIHTFRMRFAIDIAFLARDGRVLTIHHALKPNRLSKISLRAEGALELAAGRLQDTGTRVGDIIKFEEITSENK